MKKVLLSAENRPTTTVTLPQSQADVTLYKDLLTGDLMGMPDSNNKYVVGVYMLERMIKEWGFVDKDDNSMPLEKSSFDLIKAEDLGFLIKIVMKNVEDTNKDTLSKEKKSPSVNTSSATTDINSVK